LQTLKALVSERRLDIVEISQRLGMEVGQLLISGNAGHQKSSVSRIVGC